MHCSSGGLVWESPDITSRGHGVSLEDGQPRLDGLLASC